MDPPDGQLLISHHEALCFQANLQQTCHHLSSLYSSELAWALVSIASSGVTRNELLVFVRRTALPLIVVQTVLFRLKGIDHKERSGREQMCV